MNSELDCAWDRGFDSGYRRAVEFVKKLIEKDELDSDTIVEKMMKDWASEYGN